MATPTSVGVGGDGPEEFLTDVRHACVATVTARRSGGRLRRVWREHVTEMRCDGILDDVACVAVMRDGACTGRNVLGVRVCGGDIADGAATAMGILTMRVWR